jgi:RHS repeat-associated protein
MGYDNANELLNLNTTTYAYDLNGNMTQKIDGSTTTTYTYDDENRLIGVEITGGTNSVIAYAYDPFGRRIEKNVDGTVTTYLYDKEAIILEYDQTGTVTARYRHGIGIDEPLTKETSSQTYYYHADGLGSIVALTNASGNVVQTYTYDSFGNITTGLPTSQPYTYTAREYDPETGLYFYRARYYDPKAGRFLKRDPISFAGGDVNLYGFVKNNPVNWTDPEGFQTAFRVPAPAPFPPITVPQVKLTPQQWQDMKDFFSRPGQNIKNWIETISAPGDKQPLIDLTGTPESCDIQYRARLAACECQNTQNVTICKLKAWLAYVMCMWNNM